MLVLYFARLVLLLPVLAAIAAATAIASTAGLLMRALRLMIVVPAFIAGVFLLTPDESDAQGEGGRHPAATAARALRHLLLLFFPLQAATR